VGGAGGLIGIVDGTFTGAPTGDVGRLIGIVDGTFTGAPTGDNVFGRLTGFDIVSVGNSTGTCAIVGRLIGTFTGSLTGTRVFGRLTGFGIISDGTSTGNCVWIGSSTGVNIVGTFGETGGRVAEFDNVEGDSTGDCVLGTLTGFGIVLVGTFTGAVGCIGVSTVDGIVGTSSESGGRLAEFDIVVVGRSTGAVGCTIDGSSTDGWGALVVLLSGAAAGGKLARPSIRFCVPGACVNPTGTTGDCRLVGEPVVSVAPPDSVPGSFVPLFTAAIDGVAKAGLSDGPLLDSPSSDTSTASSDDETIIKPSGTSNIDGGPSGAGIPSSPVFPFSRSIRCLSHAPNPRVITASYTNEVPGLGLTV